MTDVDASSVAFNATTINITILSESKAHACLYIDVQHDLGVAIFAEDHRALD